MTQCLEGEVQMTRTVHGHVERFTGCYLAGWAAPADWSSHSTIRVTGAMGEDLASGTADRDRADLMSLGQGRSDMAFHIWIPSLGDESLLHVYADDIELPGSPLIVGAGSFDGDLTVSCGIISGWVSERRHDFAPPEVEIVDQDGVIVGVIQSSFGNPSDGPEGRAAHFYGLLHQRCFLDPETILTARVDRKPFACARSTLALQGHLDLATTTRVTGWLHSPDAPDRQFDLEIFRDGVLAARTRTNLKREDVQSAFPTADRPGFDVELPELPGGALQACVLSIRFAGCERDILQGPHLLGGQPALVTAARRASSALLRGDAPPDPTLLAVTQMALASFLKHSRHEAGMVSCRSAVGTPAASPWRMTIIIPCYADTEGTFDCISSVLAVRHPGTDRILLINDASPEHAMGPMLERFSATQNLVVLTNQRNLGFVGSVNRGLSMCSRGGDVLLLNSDTRMFPGALDGLHRVAHAAPDIGTATALSNTATIFSYPHEQLQTQALDDVSWEALAGVARAENRDLAIEVPTGHGFCMLIREDVLRRVGQLDTAYGRGYGEENDFCARASDLGYRHMVAAEVFVQHRESISFGAEKASLVARNLERLRQSYPEYLATVMDFIAREGLRKARWALDRNRIRALVQAGENFVLVINHGLGGGTGQAVRDIEAAVGYGGAIKLTLSCKPDGTMEIDCEGPSLRIAFARDEVSEIFDLLSAAFVWQVVVHSVLGFSAEFIQALGGWVATRHGTFYLHDFYPVCPRVTMIDASAKFCDIAPIEVCTRCVEQGGVHEASRLGTIGNRLHRELFGNVLASFSKIIAPSKSSASYLRRCFPHLKVTAMPHPEQPCSPAATRPRGEDELVLFGALGPHKGSGLLLALARRAKLTTPGLSFRVIGHTDVDAELLTLGNVTVTGRYEPAALPELVAQARGRAALFLHRWPETYSYTLSEAIRHGFVPIVPDVGAPADRVRASGVGAVYRLDTELDDLLRISMAVLEDAADLPVLPPIDEAVPPAPLRVMEMVSGQRCPL